MEKEELRLWIKYMSGKAAEEIKKGTHYQPEKIIAEPDPVRPELIVVKRDSFGNAINWAYGPYHIGRSNHPGWAYADLLIGMEDWQKDLYGSIPTELPSRPLEMLLNRIDKVLSDLKKGIKSY